MENDIKEVGGPFLRLLKSIVTVRSTGYHPPMSLEGAERKDLSQRASFEVAFRIDTEITPALLGKGPLTAFGTDR